MERPDAAVGIGRGGAGGRSFYCVVAAFPFFQPFPLRSTVVRETPYLLMTYGVSRPAASMAWRQSCHCLAGQRIICLFYPWLVRLRDPLLICHRSCGMP